MPEENVSIELIVLFLVIAYMIFCIAYWLLHRFCVLLPSKKITKLPSHYGITYDEVFFHSEDGTRLHGWFLFTKENPIRIDDQEAVIVFFPGYEGTVSKFLPGLNAFLKHGFNVFAFGYRGFGHSDFRWPTEKGVYKDAEAAVRFLTKERGIQSQQMVLYGQSLGCAMASQAAVYIQPRAVVLEGGFLSLADQVSRFIKFIPVRLLTTSRFSLQARLAKLQCPVLVAHSKEDKAVSSENAQKIFSAAHEPKNTIMIHGSHAKGLEVEPEPYMRALIDFVTQSY
jgi:alpha-beta hydrolase superfamily lysophospholipase